MTTLDEVASNLKQIDQILSVAIKHSIEYDNSETAGWFKSILEEIRNLAKSSLNILQKPTEDEKKKPIQNRTRKPTILNSPDLFSPSDLSPGYDNITSPSRNLKPLRDPFAISSPKSQPLTPDQLPPSLVLNNPLIVKKPTPICQPLELIPSTDSTNTSPLLSPPVMRYESTPSESASPPSMYNHSERFSIDSAQSTSPAPTTSSRQKYEVTSPPISPAPVPENVMTLEENVMNKYKIGESIGYGSCGTVHKCIEKETSKELAVKIISRKAGPKVWKGSIRESVVLQTLHHPMIINLHECMETSTHLYMFMDLMKHEIRTVLLKIGKYPEHLAATVITCIISAIDYIHKESLVHRDIKVENILLKNDPLSIPHILDNSGKILAKDPSQQQQLEDYFTEVVLVDFGLVEFISECRSIKDCCGTLDYIAPEVLECKEGSKISYGKECDMWSIGVVCYILLEGKMPFTAPDQKILQSKILKGEYNFGPENNLSSDAKDFVSKLLDLKPETRMTTRQALAHPWITSNFNLRMNNSQNAAPAATTTTRKSRSFTQSKNNNNNNSNIVEDVSRSNSTDAPVGGRQHRKTLSSRVRAIIALR